MVRYEIRVAGRLPQHWADWCDGFACTLLATGESVLSGSVPDQAALIGVLSALCQMNLTLRVVRRLD